jgi:hypothetical protein
MDQNSATQPFSLAETQFCCHINISAVALKVRYLGTGYMIFLECYGRVSSVSFSHAYFISKFQKPQCFHWAIET